MLQRVPIKCGLNQCQQNNIIGQLYIIHLQHLILRFLQGSRWCTDLCEQSLWWHVCQRGVEPSWMESRGSLWRCQAATLFAVLPSFFCRRLTSLPLILPCSQPPLCSLGSICCTGTDLFFHLSLVHFIHHLVLWAAPARGSCHRSPKSATTTTTRRTTTVTLPGIIPVRN